MFNRLDRYTLRTFLGPFLLTVVFAVALYVVIDTADMMDDIVEGGDDRDLTYLLSRYHWYRLPVLLPKLGHSITTIAVAIAVARLARRKELLAMKALGQNPQRRLMPLLVAAFLVAALLAGLQEAMLPNVSEKLQKISVELLGSGGKKPHIYNDVMVRDSEGNVIIAREYNARERAFYDGELVERDPRSGQHGVTRIKKGKWDRGEERWYLTGSRQMLVDGGRRLDFVSFENEVWQTDVTPRDFTEKHFVAALRTVRELMEMRREATRRKFLTRREADAPELTAKECRLSVLIHDRFALPFTAVAVVMVALPFVAREEKHGAVLGVGFSVLICALFYMIHVMLLDLGSRPALGLPPWVTGWGSTILFAILGLYCFKRIGK